MSLGQPSGPRRSHDDAPLTPKEAAPLLGVAVGAVYALLKRGALQHYRVGPRIFIMLGEIERFRSAGGERRG